MPYIKADRRPELNQGECPKNAGELNYILTKEIDRYRREHGDSYAVFNDIMGAIEGAKLEFYRRKVVPYENIKITENGDVYIK